MSKLFTLSQLFWALLAVLGSTTGYAKPGTENLTFKQDGQTFHGELILTSGKDPLNRLAKEVGGSLNGMKLIFSSKVLESANARGAYSYIINSLILMPTDTVDYNTYKILLHELVHAHIWSALRKGMPTKLSGLIYNKSPSFQSRAYGPFFGLDEVAATFFSYQFNLDRMKELIIKAREGDRNAFVLIEETVGQLRTYGGRLLTMFETLERGLGSQHQIELAEPPKGIRDLNRDLEWSKISAGEIAMFLPQKNVSQSTQNILKFVRFTLPTINKIDTMTFKYGGLSNEDRIQGVEAILDAATPVINSFGSVFTEELKIMDYVSSKYGFISP